jgi:hypothetical protein
VSTVSIHETLSFLYRPLMRAEGRVAQAARAIVLVLDRTKGRDKSLRDSGLLGRLQAGFEFDAITIHVVANLAGQAV